MRFVLAITALVLSGILLLLGIGQTTFLAGPRQVVTSAELETQNGLAVIGSDTVSIAEGQANVVVDGAAPVVAVGNVRDVEAWTAPFGYLEVTADPQSRELGFQAIPSDPEAVESYTALNGEEAAESEEQAEADLAVPSPEASDLWLDTQASAPAEEVPAEGEATDEGEEAGETAGDAVATATVRLPVDLSADQAVLVYVSDPTAATELSIQWVQDRRTPWAGPLLVAGGLFALIGAILYLLAVDHDRRGLGPRRGRKGPLLGIRNMFGGRSKESSSNVAQRTSIDTADTLVQTGAESNDANASGGRRRMTALPLLALASALALSGCSPNYWPELSAEPTETEKAVEAGVTTTNVAPVPVTEGQVDRILADIAEISGEADSSLDASGLSARFTADALKEREANYTIRQAVADYDVIVPRLTDESLGYQLIQSTETWPRTIFTVVASEPEAPAEPAEGEEDAESQPAAESPSIALIMTQANPHSNYLVSRSIALRGGITMPEAAPAEEGTARLANDIESLVIKPADLGSAYAAVLAGGAEVAEAELFDLEGDTLLERSGSAWVAQSTAAAQAAGQGIKYSVSADQTSARIVSLSTGAGGALVATTVNETRVEEPDGGRWRPTVPKSLTALSGLEGQQEKLVSVVAHQLLFFVPSATDGGPIELLGYSSDLIEARNS